MPRHPEVADLLLRQDRSAPVVALQAWIDAGAADETDDESGACHLVEHMLFRGSGGLEPGELARRIEEVGGDVNAFTTPDQVVVQATVASRCFADVAPLLADAVLRPRFDPELLAIEKKVVLEELRRDLDAPGHQLSRAVAAAAWTRHPYRRPIAGTAESVTALGAEGLDRFHRRWFRPGRITVVAVGDLEPQEARGLLGKAFAAATPDDAPPERNRPADPEQTGLRCLVREGPFEAARFELALPGTSLDDPDTPLLDLLILCLGQGRASRLNREIRLRRRLVDGLSAGCWSPRDTGLVTISGLTSTERVLAGISGCLDVARGLTDGLLDEVELARAKACIEAERDYERETMDGQARTLGYWSVAGGEPDAEERYRQRIRAATAEQLRSVARRFFHPDRLTAGLLLPQGSGVDEGALRTAVEGRLTGIEASSAGLVPPAPPPSSRPAHRAARRPGPAVTRTLPDGGRIRIEPRTSAPIFALRLLFPGGLRAETPQNCGLHALLARCWTRGTQSLDSHALAMAAEGLGGTVLGAAGWSSFGLAAGFPTRSLAPALDLVEEILLRPALDEDSFEQERSLALEAARRELDRPGALAFRRFAQLRYGDHPWGLPPGGTEASLAALDLDSLRRTLADRRPSGEAVLALVGDVDAEEVAGRMEALLARLPAAVGPPILPPAPAPVDRPRLEHVPSRRALAHLVVGFPALAAADPDGPALDLLHKLLSGQSGRLFRELRDREGLAYEVGSTGATGIDPGWFAVYLATDPDKIPSAQAAVHRELERLIVEPVDGRELDAARTGLQGSFEISRQSYSAVVDGRAADALCGLGWEYADGFCDRLDQVSAEDVQAVARRIIDPSRLIEVVAGPSEPEDGS